MRVAGGVGVEEGAALLEEVVELALLVASAGLLAGEAAGGAGSLEEDVGDAVEGELLAGAEFLLLVLDLLPA
jgi:hypothetical protein